MLFKKKKSTTIHVSTNDQFHSFLWLNTIPLYICTITSLSVPQLMDILQTLSQSERKKKEILHINTYSWNLKEKKTPEEN